MAEDFDIGTQVPLEDSNRTFVIAAAAIGGLLVLSMICLGVYALVIAPQQQPGRSQQATEIVLENTRVAQSLTETAAAEQAEPTATSTDTPVPPTDTPAPTATRVVVLPSDTPEGTAAATETQVAGGAQATVTPSRTPTRTPTALPQTGFAEDIGLPGLILAAFGLLGIIVIARSMRTRST